MNKLVRWVLVIAGMGLVFAWWVVLGHIMKSPSVWVDMGQWLGECVLFLVALLFIMAGLLFGANASVHKPKAPARVAMAPPAIIRCERCHGAIATLYSKKRDLLCCDPCAFAVTLPIDDLCSVDYGLTFRAGRQQAARG
jgi:hypothetical protein